VTWAEIHLTLAVMNWITAAAVAALVSCVVSAVTTTTLARRRERFERELKNKEQAAAVRLALRKERDDQKTKATEAASLFINAVHTFTAEASRHWEGLLPGGARRDLNELRKLRDDVDHKATVVHLLAGEAAILAIDVQQQCILAVEAMVPPAELEPGLASSNPNSRGSCCSSRRRVSSTPSGPNTNVTTRGPVTDGAAFGSGDATWARDHSAHRRNAVTPDGPPATATLWSRRSRRQHPLKQLRQPVPLSGRRGMSGRGAAGSVNSARSATTSSLPPCP
jgi:hypothetical protein